MVSERKSIKTKNANSRSVRSTDLLNLRSDSEVIHISDSVVSVVSLAIVGFQLQIPAYMQQVYAGSH